MIDLRVPLMLAASVVCAYASGDRTCKIKTMIGDVQIEHHGSAKWINAKVGMPLSESDAVRTFVESSAELETGEGTILSVGENTAIELKVFTGKTEGAGSSTVRILNGSLLANVKKLVGAGSSFDFKTPTAVASIRGTKVGFDVGTDSTGISVFEGHVLVTPAGANAGTMLTVNQRTVVMKGKTTVTVVKFVPPAAPTADSKLIKIAPAKPDSSVHKPDSTTIHPKDTSAHPLDTTTLKPAAKDSSTKIADTSAQKQLPKDTTAMTPAKGTTKDTVATGHSDTVPVVPAAASTMQKDTTAQTTSPALLILKLSTPADHSTIVKPQVTVAGTTTPGASVTVAGVSAAVGGDGSFSRDIFFPNEEGDHMIDVEASLGSQNKSVSVTVTYKAPTVAIGLRVSQPTEGQIVCDQNVTISGTIQSKTATINVGGRGVANSGGSFSDVTQIPTSSPGTFEIRFDATDGNNDTTITRHVVYDPAGSKQCNVDAPTVIPSTIPSTSTSASIYFTVNDRTPFDELTVYKSIDGRSESQSLSPGSRVELDLTEGLHAYQIWAADKVGNLSPKISGSLSYLPQNPAPSISVREPSGGNKTILVPPGNPGADFEPTFTLEFDVLNIPNDDPRLVGEIDIVQTSGGSYSTSMRQLSSLSDVSSDVRLSRGVNSFRVDLHDVTGRITSKTISITVK